MTPTHADMVAAIVDTYRQATDAQRADGRAWYGTAGTIARSIAEATDQTAERVAYAMAALSPRNPWRWNIADAYAFASAASRGDDRRPTATTFNPNAERAWAILRGGDAWSGAALKVRAFVAAILGDPDSVVVDVWAVRVATRGAVDHVTSDGAYRSIAAAYTDAAAIVGDSPSAVQAVTWLVAQSTGIGSHRRGRHDQTFKRGTAPFVLALMAAA